MSHHKHSKHHEDLAAHTAEQAARTQTHATFADLAYERGEIRDLQVELDERVAHMLQLCDSLPGRQIFLTGNLHAKNGHSTNPAGPEAPVNNLPVRVTHAVIQIVRNEDMQPDYLHSYSPIVEIGARVLEPKNSTETVTAWHLGSVLGVDIRLTPDGDPLPY